MGKIYIYILIAVALLSGFIVFNNRRAQPDSQLANIELPSLESTNNQLSESISNELSPEPTEQQVTMVAVGDIMTSRVVGQRMVEKGYDYPFKKTTHLFTNQDLVFGNLETPVIAGPPVNTGTMVFRSDPEVLPVIKAAGFNILSLANNHSMNKGSAGLISTLDLMKEQELKWVGAGSNINETRQPLIVEINGLKIAILAYTDTDVIPETYAATTEKPGVNIMNVENLKADIGDVKNKVDFVVVGMHSGTEYVVEPNARQLEFAHTAINAGAHIVIGSHPHVVQRAEIYNEKPIFYSLGNFVFDQMWSQDTREGLVVYLTFTKKSEEKTVQINKLVPVQIDDYAQPNVIKDENQRQRILERLGDYQKLLDEVF